MSKVKMSNAFSRRNSIGKAVSALALSSASPVLAYISATAERENEKRSWNFREASLVVADTGSDTGSQS
jgi:hypothetical protein